MENSTNSASSTRTSLLITILSMLFTVLSILLSVFEHALSSKITQYGSIMIARLSLKCQMIANMSEREFAAKLIYTHKRKLIHLVSKTLHINKQKIERMIPTQSTYGATYIFIIIEDLMHFDYIWNLLYKSIENKTFADKVKSIYGFSDDIDIPTEKLYQWRVLVKDNKEVEFASVLPNAGSNCKQHQRT